MIVRPIAGGHDVNYGGKCYRVLSDWQFGQPLFKGTVGGTPVCIQVERRNMMYRLFHWGSQVDVMVLSARAAELLAAMPEKKPPDTSKYLLSPMPGLLSQLMVAVGDEVKIGQHLAVVEAMKMENVLCAERDGRVNKRWPPSARRWPSISQLSSSSTTQWTRSEERVGVKCRLMAIR